MKLGTQIKLPDGRIGTAVFNGLTGVGIKWGKHDPDPKDFEGTNGDLFQTERPDDWPWEPDAMLRARGLDEVLGMECAGTKFEILRDGPDK